MKYPVIDGTIVHYVLTPFGRLRVFVWAPDGFARDDPFVLGAVCEEVWRCIGERIKEREASMEAA